eukprot:gene13734-15167_t
MDKEQNWQGPFCFVQAADPQFGLIDNWNGVDKSDITWDKEIDLTNKAFQCINNLKPRPKFVAMCGDLVDADPGTRMHDLQKVDFLKCMKVLDEDIPLLCMPGNHDIGNVPTDESVKSYKNDFGDDYYSFVVGGVLFIVINNQFHKDASKVPELHAKHDLWLEEQLKAAEAKTYKHAIVLQHIPLFHDTPDEDEDYFNIEKCLREKIITRLKTAGVKHVFAGHYHKNDVGKDGDLEMVITSAIGLQLGNDKAGMRIVRVFENHVDHKYYDFDSFPNEISLQDDTPLP